MATKEELLKRKESLETQLKRVNLLIEQSEFVGQLVVGARVDGITGDGEEFTSGQILGVTEKAGNTGHWFKVLINEGTPDVALKSLRLSNITGVVPAATDEVE